MMSFVSPLDGKSWQAPRSTEELDGLLASGHVMRGTDLHNRMRQILDAKASEYDPIDDPDLGSLLQQIKAEASDTPIPMRNQDMLSIAGSPQPLPYLESPSPAIVRHYPRIRSGAPLRGRGGGAPRRRMVARGRGGLAAVRAGARLGPGSGVGAVHAAPLGAHRVARLRRQRFRPPDHDPEIDRSYTYTKTLPGDKFEIFKRRNQELDPLATILCSGQKYEIGEHIQLCIDPTQIHIVIYKRATLKGITILITKIKHHIKNMVSAKLGEFGMGIIYDWQSLKSSSAKQIATVIFRLLRKRGRFLRLIIKNSQPGGSLSKSWMHAPSAMRRISKELNK